MEDEVDLSQEWVVTPVVEGIEYAHLDIAMPAERQDLLITRDKSPSSTKIRTRTPRSAACSRASAMSRPCVAAKDEVLHVDGRLGGIDHLNSCDEPVDSPN